MEAQARMQVKDWQTLSEAASREQDSEKLIRLVEELNHILAQPNAPRKRHSTN